MTTSLVNIEKEIQSLQETLFKIDSKEGELITLYIQAGEFLFSIRQKLPPKSFSQWIEDNLSISRMTAYRYIKLFENKAIVQGKTRTEAYNELTFSGICNTVLHMPENDNTFEEPEIQEIEWKVQPGNPVSPAKTCSDCGRSYAMDWDASKSGYSCPYCWRDRGAKPADVESPSLLPKENTFESPQPRLNVHFTSDSEEWYTPPEIVSAAIDLFGAIDLDPCSNSKESPSIPAKAHYTKGDDGLAQEWFGKVYMNPPYGRVIADWVAKAADEYECGNVSGALLLVPARTDTAWMARVRKYPRCYVRGRLRFSNSPDAAPFPSCVVYLGDDEKRFFQAFSKLGDIYKLVGYE